LPTIANVDARDFSDLACWLIVQIGPISLNVTTPYKHRYGDPRPHRGGQEVIPFKRDLWVYWAATDNSVRAEHLMIERFRELVDRMPYANRVRASRQSSRTRKQKRIVSA